MPLPLLAIGMGVAQAGLGIASGMQQQNQAYAESAYNTAFQNAMAGIQNRSNERNFNRQVDRTKEQFGYNRDAANRAYSTEQARYNELLTQAAFQQQGAIQNLLEVQGTNNASERYGRSAKRVSLVDSLGAYGRNQAMRAESLISAQRQSNRNLEGVSRDWFNSDLNAWSQVGISPNLQAEVAMPQAPSGMNTALMIGSNLLSGFNTYNSLKAPSVGSFGNMPTRSVSNNTNLAYSYPGLLHK